jgi:ParB family chromosome partitioning protein
MVDSITDQALFEQMDRENRQRSNLRPWEQGEMYRKALEDGLYSGVSQMAEALGQSKGNVSVALKIANFPKEILAAFPSPVSIQFRWATPLGKFIEENSQLAIFRAKEITGERQSGVAIDANLTFSRLVEPIKAKPLAPRKEVEIGEVTLICSAKKDGTASISLSKIPADKADAVEKAIIKALS